MEQNNTRSVAAEPAAEKTVWTGRSSQVKNFWAFVSCVLILPIPWALWRYLQVRCRVFQLSTERLIITQGVLNKSKESLELYRVRDLRVIQPFWVRLFGLENVELITTDSSSPTVTIDCIASSEGVPDLCRKHIEACRVAKGVRELDVE